MRNDIVLVRYGEVGLKSERTRNRYEKILMDNIHAMLEQEGVDFEVITRSWGRIYVHTRDLGAADAAARVFGVVSTSSAVSTTSQMSDMKRVASRIGAEIIGEGESFAIRPRRTGDQEYSSRDMGVEIGDAVWKALEEKGVTPVVDLDNPDHEIHVEARDDHGYVFTSIIDGVGGLPLGTQGRMVALVSGGIDSPVAAWLMMKRGCEIIPLYVDNTPYADETTRERAMNTIRALRKWSPGHPFKVYEVPNGDTMTEIVENVDRRLTCLMCKRSMYRIARAVSEREDALGIITGSSLGQVASQTAENLLAEAMGLEYPVYHPLIGMDKTEIIELAKHIDTYEESIQPATCCMAVPDYPATHAKPQSVQKAEETINLEELIEGALGGAKVHEI